MKNFRNNSAAFLLVVSFLICVSFVDHALQPYGSFDYFNVQDTTRQPKMVVEEITVQSMIVLAIRDTAASMENIGPTLAKSYGEIGGVMNKNGLQYAGAPLAWYHTDKPPFIMEAGIPVNAKPATTEGRVVIKEIPQSKAVVVHFWGPYEMTGQAYTKIQEWLKKNNKKAIGAPFDVYLTDPTSVTDPYQVQTDIIQIYQ